MRLITERKVGVISPVTKSHPVNTNLNKRKELDKKDSKDKETGNALVIEKAGMGSGFKPNIVYCFDNRLSGPLCVRCLQKDICEYSKG